MASAFPGLDDESTIVRLVAWHCRLFRARAVAFPPLVVT